MSHTYAATASREGRWWMVAIPELDGLTQARRLAEAETMAREWIAVTLDRPMEEIAVTLTVETVDGIEVAAKLAAIRDQRRRAAAIEAEAMKATVELAKALADQDVPVRDIGAALGVSFQRAHQFLQTAA